MTVNLRAFMPMLATPRKTKQNPLESSAEVPVGIGIENHRKMSWVSDPRVLAETAEAVEWGPARFHHETIWRPVSPTS